MNSSSSGGAQKPGVWATLAMLLCALAACHSLPFTDDGDDRRLPDGGGGRDGGTGLPCEVAALLQARCAGCHRSPPVAGATMALLDYEDLARPSAVMPGQTVARRSLVRMLDGARPMPPGAAPSVPAAEVAAFRAWVEAGLPRGACGGGADLGPDPFSTPPQCTSGRFWRYDDDDVNDSPEDDGEPEMNPGQACIACHQRDRDAPRLFVGGTVYPTGHEPDLCIGAMGASVEITDVAGVVRQLSLNRSGNFLLRDDGRLKPPLRARVLFQGRERRMNGAVPHGDCNGCHTQDGESGAPGRVVLP